MSDDMIHSDAATLAALVTILAGVSIGASLSLVFMLAWALVGGSELGLGVAVGSTAVVAVSTLVLATLVYRHPNRAFEVLDDGR